MDTFRVGSSGPARIILIGQRAKDEAVRTLKALETQGLSPHLRHPTPISGAMYESRADSKHDLHKNLGVFGLQRCLEPRLRDHRIPLISRPLRVLRA